MRFFCWIYCWKCSSGALGSCIVASEPVLRIRIRFRASRIRIHYLEVWIRIRIRLRIRIFLSSCKNSKKNHNSYYFVTPFDFLSLKNYVHVPSKSNKQKKLFQKISFLLASWGPMTKIAGSGSGSISQRHGSADPDPHQNVMDPQHCSKHKEPVSKPMCSKFQNNWRCCLAENNLKSIENYKMKQQLNIISYCPGGEELCENTTLL